LKKKSPRPESHTADDWGFVLITSQMVFNCVPLNDFATRQTKRQNNKVINSK
jgi:hypothetical protein